MNTKFLYCVIAKLCVGNEENEYFYMEKKKQGNLSGAPINKIIWGNYAFNCTGLNGSKHEYNKERAFIYYLFCIFKYIFLLYINLYFISKFF